MKNGGSIMTKDGNVVYYSKIYLKHSMVYIARTDLVTNQLYVFHLFHSKKDLELKLIRDTVTEKVY